MKKVLIGCLIFLVLLIGLMIGVGWYIFVKAKEFAEGFDLSAAVEQMQQIDRDFPWDPPLEPTALDAARYEDYLAVRTRINDRLMQVRLFAEVARAAEEEREANINMLQLLGLARDIPLVLRETADAFRGREMSFREFGYYSRESLRAIRAGAERGDPELAQAWERLRGLARYIDAQFDRVGDAGTVDAGRVFDTLSSEGVPAETIAVVRPHAGEFTESPSRFVVELIFITILQGDQGP